jgi:hypothetical protein
MTTLVTKLLGPPEKVEPFAFFPTHPHRWMIFETRYFKVYLHHASNEDLDVDLRAYPGQFISFGFAISNGRTSAATPNAVRDRAAWMVLIAKSPRQRERGD